MKTLRQELGLIATLALAAYLGTRLLGYDKVIFGIAGAVYLAWHVTNVVRLIVWLETFRFRAPFSFGIWEHIFDRLQAANLRSRKRKRDLVGLVRQLRLVLGGIADAVVLFDDRGRVRWFNTAARRLLGVGKPGTSKKPITEILDHPFLSAPDGASRERRSADIASPVNGAVVLRIEVSDLEGTGQRLLIARDITKTHHLEHARKDFVANVSHELRTPLTVFRGYLETLIDGIGQHSDLAGPMSQLDQQAVRMQRLVEDLLDLSRVEFTDRSSPGALVDLAGLLTSIVDDMRPLAATRHQSITLNVDRKLGLMGNAAILRMIAANLIANAVKHTDAGTEIAVIWRRLEDGALFQVRDTGQGIAAEHLPRLTERFYRVDPGRSRQGGGGTGLGLAIVKHALERHDADMRIESTPGLGSMFTCRFPAGRLIDLSKHKPGRQQKPTFRNDSETSFRSLTES